ncbi:MAG: hypothetical protein RBU21_09810 [FCB group bacterium]|nr:hypothetical protein [FCB group bacterium]
MKRIVTWIAVSALAALWPLLPAAALEGWNWEYHENWHVDDLTGHTGHFPLYTNGGICSASDELGGIGVAYITPNVTAERWEVWYKHSSGTSCKLGNMPWASEVFGHMPVPNYDMVGPINPAVAISFVADLCGESLKKAVIAVAAGYADQVDGDTADIVQVVKLFAFDLEFDEEMDFEAFNALNSEVYGPEADGAFGWTIKYTEGIESIMNRMGKYVVAVGTAYELNTVAIAVKEMKDSDVKIDNAWINQTTGYSIMKGCSVAFVTDPVTGDVTVEETDLWQTPDGGMFNADKIAIHKHLFGDAEIDLTWVAGGNLYFLGGGATDPCEKSSVQWLSEPAFAGSGDISDYWMAKDSLTVPGYPSIPFGPSFAWKTSGPNNTNGYARKYRDYATCTWVTQTVTGTGDWRLCGFALNASLAPGNGRENYLYVRDYDSEHDPQMGEKFWWSQSPTNLPANTPATSQWVAPAGVSSCAFQNPLQVSGNNVFVVTTAPMTTPPYGELVIRTGPLPVE